MSKTTNGIDDRSLDILTKTLWGEARGEPYKGLVAVAHVILNRARKPGWWGSSIETVCLKQWQFSCWNKSDPNYAYLSGLKAIPGRDYVRCRDAALAAVQGHETDPTGGATHYYATALRNPPAWARGAKMTVAIGGHVFFKDVP